MKIAVVGGGVVGLSTTVELIRLGHDVTCLEAGEPMGERSAGDTRIFRLAHAYPDMVELAGRARRLFPEGCVDGAGTVVSGDGVESWASAMAAAGATHEIVAAGSRSLRLPATDIAGPILVDPAGGVIRVDRLRTHLIGIAHRHLRRARVDLLERAGDRVRIWSPDGPEEFDTALICAGAETSGLAAGVGIMTPPALEHHVRFSFPIRPEAPRPLRCWITLGGFGTYQHSSAAGTWAVGADVDPVLVSWAGGREAAEQASRDAVTAYVARELPFVEPRVVGQLYCTHNPDLSDGLQFVRSGPILTIYGENFMKFAPLLGAMLAEALIDGSTPPDAGPGAR
ncbi:FAD-dependent oxidoreductase [Actinoplanes sp. NPDC023714]|uniref:FAD-dependent oxidoreductase n=1 Tax=Actinoplanes sp. NPDC023714 TaxID=3154322 RepID=UPI0033E63CFC